MTEHMDFAQTDRGTEFAERLEAFMTESVYPAEAVWEEQLAASGDPHGHPQILEDLKEDARSRGLWNLFHPDPEFGPGLTNAEYAPLAEITGRSAHLAPEACNCSAPDTGNMEVLTQFGTDAQKEEWLRPLLDGEIRSAFAMTEPDVASSDATNIQLRIERDGDEYVLNGRKWWTSGAMRDRCRVFIVMGKTDPDGPTYKQQSQILVPRDTPGVTIKRNLQVFGYTDVEGHAEVLFEDVRVPVSNLIAGEGDGFMIAQARLGPGRIHHCMRTIGVAERALEMLCQRAISAGDVRQAGGDALEHPRLGRGGAHPARDGAPAHAQDRVADGHRRQQARAHGDRGDQGGGAGGRAEDHRPRHPGARRRRRLPGLPAGGDVRARAHAAARRRPGRGAQADDRAPGDAEVHGVIVERDGETAVLRLDRPRAAQRDGHGAAARRCSPRCEDARDAHAVVVSTTDVAALSAGADVGEELDAEGGVARMDLFTQLYAAVEAHPAPTVAVCVGNCVGAGAELAAGCDLRVGGDNLKLAWAGRAPRRPGRARRAWRR